MDAENQTLAALAETRHWWFRGRRAVLGGVLDRVVRDRTPPWTVLEAGCGNGGNLPMLAQVGDVFAFEPDAAARQRAADRGVAHVAFGTLPDGVPFDGVQFDLILATDVLEHVHDDARSLEHLRERLRGTGWLLVTVPAYAWLWSAHDVASHHYRRYTSRQLADLLTRTGFDVVHISYFNTLLFPMALAYLALGRILRTGSRGSMTVPPAPLNDLFSRIFSAEARFVPRLAFPFGLSVLAVARPSQGDALKAFRRDRVET
jgi:SAM-dependent methyltransferase